VRAWKEHGRRPLAAHAAALVLEVVSPPEVGAVTHVPGDPERARERGAVPPRALARELARAWRLPAVDVLRRTAALPRQRGLGLEERRRNVRGSVAAAAHAPRAVCVVDDVYTSGATADAGARRVEVVTLARAVR
jgi:predicted amidophosphoribosyltransferase